MINMGMTFEEVRDSIFCKKCGDRGYERHHITYFPEKLAKLCRNCHQEITDINTRYSRKVRRKLTNKERITLWDDFISKRTNYKSAI